MAVKPPWVPGLFRMLAATSAGGRVELLDENKERTWFQVQLRVWDGQRGVTGVLIERLKDGRKFLATPKGWVEK